MSCENGNVECEDECYCERCEDCDGFVDLEDWEADCCECDAEEEEESSEERAKRLFVQRIVRDIDERRAYGGVWRV